MCNNWEVILLKCPQQLAQHFYNLHYCWSLLDRNGSLNIPQISQCSRFELQFTSRKIRERRTKLVYRKHEITSIDLFIIYSRQWFFRSTSVYLQSIRLASIFSWRGFIREDLRVYKMAVKSLIFYCRVRYAELVFSE